MAGTFALNTAAHATTNFVMVHGRLGTQYKLTPGTPIVVSDPADRAAVRQLRSATGVAYATET